MMNASGEFESFDENERRYPMSSVFVETGAMPAMELEVLFVSCYYAIIYRYIPVYIIFYICTLE